MKEKDYKAISRFSSGKYSYRDYLKVKKLFNQIDEDEKVKEQFLKNWQELIDANDQESGSMDHVFEKIQTSISLEEKGRVKKLSIWNFYRQAAAVLFIPLLTLSLWFYLSSRSLQQVPTQQIAQSWVEINAPDVGRVEFLLPDSSSGWLNSGAKLKYPVVFHKHRKVELTGEAYFDVTHLDQSDFTVSVPDMDIKVLGTKFNISAYPGDPGTDVVLAEGNIEITGKAGVFTHILKPDDKITFNRELKTLNMERVNASRYLAWKDGYLIIENESLDEVISRLERWYNVEITVLDEELKNYRFKATFKDEPIEEVLRLIAKTTPIKFNVEKRTVGSTGIMEKKKITIRLK